MAENVARDPVVDHATAAALGVPFRKLAASAGLSNLADGIFKLALPLVAIRYTRSPALVAGIELLRTVPWLLFALPVGALTDRLDRRHTMISANVVRTVMVLVPAVAIGAGSGSIGLLYVAAVGTGIAEVFYDTSSQSILPNLVPRSRLGRANGRLAAIEQGAQQFAGPPLAGLLVAVAAAAAFWSAAALWVGAVVLLMALRGNFRPTRAGPARTIRADIAEGVRFLLTRPLLRAMAAMVGLANLTSSAAGAVFVLYAVGAESSLGLTEAQFGVLVLTAAAGGIAATFIHEHVERLLGRAGTLTVSIFGMALWVGAPALTTDVLLIAVSMVLGGAAIMLWNIPTVSFRQAITPDHLLGRLNSVYRLLAWGTMPLGAALGGFIAEAFGLRTVFASMGLLTLVLLIPNVTITDTKLNDAETEAAATFG